MSKKDVLFYSFYFLLYNLGNWTFILLDNDPYTRYYPQNKILTPWTKRCFHPTPNP